MQVCRHFFKHNVKQSSLAASIALNRMPNVPAITMQAKASDKGASKAHNKPHKKQTTHKIRRQLQSQQGGQHNRARSKAPSEQNAGVQFLGHVDDTDLLDETIWLDRGTSKVTDILDRQEPLPGVTAKELARSRRASDQRQGMIRLAKALCKQEVVAVLASYTAHYRKCGNYDTLSELFSSEPLEAERAQAASMSVQATLSAMEFAEGLDAVYLQKDDVLWDDWGGFLFPVYHMKRGLRYLRLKDFPRLLEADMPLECMIIKHCEVFLELL